ncbi:MAG TPA: hypothetical protein VM365_08215 [Gemmatimonadales bacterium]|nr:hypothetical protein [Gemmatimonadales bacterium]
MTSPRGIRSLWKHTLIVAALLTGRAGSALHAQDTTAPSNPPSGNPPTSTNVDSAGRPPDSTAVPSGQTGAPPDSLVPDSLRRDTSAARSTPSGASAPAADPPAPPPAVDSVLAAACRASGGEVPDLLTVVFRPTATPGERQQTVRDVGGTLLEPSQHQAPGAWYVRVPGSGRNPHVADRLILMPPVLEVGATRCPS